MPWFKIDDGFWSHPKVLELSPEALALWVRAGSYSAGHLTDGEVKRSTLRLLGAADSLADELVANGLWDLDPAGNSWWFHDWEQYQPSATATKEKRAALSVERSRAGANGAAKRWQKDGKTDGKLLSVSHEGVDSKTIAPTRPDPTRPKEEAKASSRRRPETPLPAGWKPTEAHIQYARENRLDLGKQVEAFKGHAETHDRRARNWDAAFRTWLGKATPGPVRQVTPDNEWLFNR